MPEHNFSEMTVALPPVVDIRYEIALALFNEYISHFKKDILDNFKNFRPRLLPFNNIHFDESDSEALLYAYMDMRSDRFPSYVWKFNCYENDDARVKQKSNGCMIISAKSPPDILIIKIKDKVIYRFREEYYYRINSKPFERKKITESFFSELL